MTDILMTPRWSLFGENALDKAKTFWPSFGKKALIVTGKHVAKSVMMEKLMQALEDVGMPGQLVLCGTELWCGETLEDRFDGDSLTFPLAAHGCKVYALSHTKDEQP